jgi:hypothetical protein
MKRTHPSGIVPVQYIVYAFFHLVRRLVRKGYGENIIRSDIHSLDQIGDAISQNAGFSASRARDDQNLPVGIRNGLDLVFI